VISNTQQSLQHLGKWNLGKAVRQNQRFYRIKRPIEEAVLETLTKTRNLSFVVALMALVGVVSKIPQNMNNAGT